MNKRNPKWPRNLKGDVRNGTPLKWPQDWSNEKSQCIECGHPASEHSLAEGGDGINRVFCRSCPPCRTMLMGDEGFFGPVPYFIEGPFSKIPCFEERQTTRKVDNFLPLSPRSQGITTFTLQATTPEGEKVDPITFTGLSWRPHEFERLADGDEIDRKSHGHKLHLYWLQEGRCAGCRRVMYFDHMEVDRVVPGAAGPGYTVGNVQLLCCSCNKMKGERSMEYLMAKLRIRGLPQEFNNAEVPD